MRVSAAFAFVATLLSGAAAHVCTDKVAVVVTNPAPNCGNSASNGDTLFVNYNLTLLSTFKQVDSSMIFIGPHWSQHGALTRLI